MNQANAPINAALTTDNKVKIYINHPLWIAYFQNTIQAVNNAAPIRSPAFTGVPVAPTAPQGTDTTQVATTAFTMEEKRQAQNYAIAMSVTLG